MLCYNLNTIQIAVDKLDQLIGSDKITSFASMTAGTFSATETIY